MFIIVVIIGYAFQHCRDRRSTTGYLFDCMMHLTTFLTFTFAPSGRDPFIIQQFGSRLLSSYSDEHDSSCDSSALQVFLRFSPLIGGPTFLPIHAEVLVLDSDDTKEKNREGSKCDRGVLHRIDFIPLKPTETTTLAELLSFQDVDGLVRHRKLEVNEGESNMQNDISEDYVFTSEASSQRIKEICSSCFSMKKSSFVVPIGSATVNDFITTNNVRSPKSIEDLLDKSEGMKLNLLRNNCYSFAWDVLSCLQFD